MRPNGNGLRQPPSQSQGWGDQGGWLPPGAGAGGERPTVHHHYRPHSPVSMDVPQLEQMIVEAIHDRLQEWTPFPASAHPHAVGPPPPPPPPAMQPSPHLRADRDRDRDRYAYRPPPPPPAPLKVPHYATHGAVEYDVPPRHPSPQRSASFSHEQYYSCKVDPPSVGGGGVNMHALMGVLAQMTNQMAALTDQVNGLARAVERLEQQQQLLAEALGPSATGDGEHHYHHVQRHVHHFHDVHIIGSADETVDLSGAPPTKTTVIPPEQADAPLATLNVDPQHLGKWAMSSRTAAAIGAPPAPSERDRERRPGTPPIDFGPPPRTNQS